MWRSHWCHIAVGVVRLWFWSDGGEGGEGTGYIEVGVGDFWIVLEDAASIGGG